MEPAPAWAARPVGMLLWLSVPITVLAMAASLAGVLAASTYAAEAPNWAAQAVGQDVVNAGLVYPGLLVLAWLAARGPLRAYLAWLGVLDYSAYSYLLYAEFLHFSGWWPTSPCSACRCTPSSAASWRWTSARWPPRSRRAHRYGWLVGRPPTFTLAQRQAIKKIALSRPTDHDLPFATWSLAKLADFLVAEGVVDYLDLDLDVGETHGRGCLALASRRLQDGPVGVDSRRPTMSTGFSGSPVEVVGH